MNMKRYDHAYQISYANINLEKLKKRVIKIENELKNFYITKKMKKREIKCIMQNLRRKVS